MATSPLAPVTPTPTAPPAKTTPPPAKNSQPGGGLNPGATPLRQPGGGANPPPPTGSLGNPLKPGPGGDTHIGSPAPSVTLTATQNNAWGILQSLLASYGFSGQDLVALTAWAKGQIISGNSADLITLNLQQTPQFAARFPAIIARQKAGLPPISPAEYLATERSYSQLERAAGIPVNFHDYDKLIAADVSPVELSDRITKGYQAVALADPTVIKSMQDFYGVSTGQLAAYFLDPTKATPLLEQQAVSAQIGGASAMSGFEKTAAAPEGISQGQALRLAQLGVTQPQAQQGFQKLSAERQLYEPLPGGGQVGNPLSTDALLNAQFGSDGQTQLQLQLQAEFEKGTTQQGTQVGQTQAGATGIGAVQR